MLTFASALLSLIFLFLSYTFISDKFLHCVFSVILIFFFLLLIALAISSICLRKNKRSEDYIKKKICLMLNVGNIAYEEIRHNIISYIEKEIKRDYNFSIMSTGGFSSILTILGTFLISLGLSFSPDVFYGKFSIVGKSSIM